MARLWGGKTDGETDVNTDVNTDVQTAVMTGGRRWRLVALVLAVAMLAWAGWDRWPPHWATPTDPVLQRILETGVLRVGYAVEAPYAFVDAAGQVTGESPETARLVAHALGISRIEWVQVPFDALISELLADRYDMVAASLFVTPERRARVLFSDPTLRVGAGLMVRLADADKVSSRPGLRVAVVTGSLEWERLPHWLPAAEPVAVPDLQTAQAALLVGEADAVALSWPTLARMAQASQGQLVAFRLPAWPGASADHLAYAFQPGQRGLRDAWNRAQAAVVGSPAHLAVLQRFNLGAADLARAPAFAGSAP